MKDNKISKDIIDFMLVEPIYKDKYGHNNWLVSCPKCCNFFIAREDLIKSGNTKSCGCLQITNMRNLGKSRKKTNKYIFPVGYDYGICYYNNRDDSYFIFDKDKYDIIKIHNWTARKIGKRIEPVAYINGKMVLLTRYLMNTPDNLVVDHINRNPSDNKVCNLRNCTQQQNNYNRTRGQGKVVKNEEGKFVIENFPVFVASDLSFETEEEAYKNLYQLRDIHMGEYSLMRSEEIARKNETNQFEINKHIFIGKSLEEIKNASEKYIPKIMLTNAFRDKTNNRITDEKFDEILLQAMNLHKDWQREERE